MSDRRFARPRLAVVKIGSSSLRGPDGRLDREQVARLSEQVWQARQAGTRIVLVSSGAVAAGLGPLGLDERPEDLPSLQAAAAVGQGELVHEYQKHFAKHGLAAAQILLSQDDFVRRNRYLNARTALRRLLELGAVPVINENDAVATEELSYGDNDHLAALVASMLHADLLVLLSDVDGYFDGDPRTDVGARLVDRVDDVATIDIESVGGVGSTVGSGGMRTKVESARVAVLSATHCVIANARADGVVEQVLDGAGVGTWFVAADRRVEARRLWIGFALNPHGRLAVDAGAARALTDGGRSLLSVGITRVDGAFAPGEAVEVVGPDGRPLGRGLCNYSADDVRRMAGRTTDDAAATLGPAYGHEVIHRDDLVIFGR